MKQKKTLKEVLREKGITMTGVGRVINRSPRAVQDRINGKVAFDTEEIKKLCQAYNLDIAIFFE